MNFVYFTSTLDAATWGAELAGGEGRGRIYIVEPTGEFEDDPNVTDKRFPGNPTQSFRTHEPLRVAGELVEWVGHSAERMQAMRDGLQALTDDQQQVLILKYIAGLPNQNIAKMMNRREGAVRALQMRALQTLSKYMKEKEFV